MSDKIAPLVSDEAIRLEGKKAVAEWEKETISVNRVCERHLLILRDIYETERATLHEQLEQLRGRLAALDATRAIVPWAWDDIQNELERMKEESEANNA